MIERKVEFQGRAGTLSGTLVEPPTNLSGTALIAHCFTCTQASLAATRLSRRLAERGLAALRFDFTGLGKSDGDFAESGFGANVEDLLAAAEYLEAEFAPVAVLVGHSLGGAAAIVAASRIPGLKALVTLAAPSDAVHVLGNLKGDLEALATEGSAEVSIGGRPFRITADFVAQAREADVLKAMERLTIPKLICHAPLDEIVGIDNATRLFQAARHPKSFLSLEQADHLLTDPRDAKWIGDVVAAWSSRHLDGDDAEGPPARAGMVTVVGAREGFAVDISAGSHRWRADEPASVGGTDTGPTPYDLLLGALGACTAMTIRMVAGREKIPLDSVTVTLEHTRNHRVDCDHCDDSDARIEAIDRTVSITGAMSSDQRERLLGIADRCPVHRTLTSNLHIHDHPESESSRQ